VKRRLLGIHLWLFLAALGAQSGRAAELLIVVNKSDDSASILDVNSGAIRTTVPVGHGPHEAEVLARQAVVAISNYGSREDAGRSLTLIDAEKGSALGTIDLGEGTRPHGMSSLPNGQLLVTAEGTKELLLVDPSARRVITRFPTSAEVSHMVVHSPDAKRAFVANIRSGSLSAFDLAAGKVIKDVSTGKGAEGVEISPDGKEVWVTNRAEDTVSVVDTKTLAVIGTIKLPTFPIRVKITPDGRRALVSCAQSGDVVIVDVAQRKEFKRVPIGQQAVAGSDQRLFSSMGKSPAPVGLLISPDGKRAWVASTNADVISEINLESMTIVRRLTAGKEPDGLAGIFRSK